MADCGKDGRKTIIKRRWDQNRHFWVDVEILQSGAFDGKQWKGPDKGNQADHTILRLAEDLTENAGEDVVHVTMLPEDEEDSVELHTQRTVRLESRSHQIVNREWVNLQPNQGGENCRTVFRRRIASNNIDDLRIKKYGDPEREGEPPKDPEYYKRAVTKSKDRLELWLDVEIPKEVRLRRGVNSTLQEIKMGNVWGSGGVELDGASKIVKEGGPYLRLAPYEVAINFGPDYLAVEFDASVGGDSGSAPQGDGTPQQGAGSGSISGASK
jgi:hypothetical protein